MVVPAWGDKLGQGIRGGWNAVALLSDDGGGSWRVGKPAPNPGASKPNELQAATGRHVQSVRVAGSPFCSHAGQRKTVLAVVKPYPSRFEKEPSIDHSTRTVPPLSTTATVDIKLLDSICGYDGALAAGSRGCLATRSGLRNGRPWRRVSSSVVFSARLGPPLVGADPPSHWAARAPAFWTTVCWCIREAPRGCSSSLGRVENRSRNSGPRKLHGR